MERDLGVTQPAISEAAALYLDLLKGCLTRELFPDSEFRQIWSRREVAARALARFLRRDSARAGFDPSRRAVGRDWPAQAETMIGRARLDNLQQCVVDVVSKGVPGDLIETGVWRGGATILMRGVLKALGETTRTVWVADSFQGLPKPAADKYPADAGDKLWSVAELAVGVEQVRANFARYGLLDDQVRFLEGWFKDTLPTAPIQELAVIRLDGDLYESTMDALRPLYPKLAIGGYVIVDDFGAVPACRAAIEDYRSELGITAPIREIDWSGVYWQRAD